MVHFFHKPVHFCCKNICRKKSSFPLHKYNGKDTKQEFNLRHPSSFHCFISLAREVDIFVYIFESIEKRKSLKSVAFMEARQARPLVPLFCGYKVYIVLVDLQKKRGYLFAFLVVFIG